MTKQPRPSGAKKSRAPWIAWVLSGFVLLAAILNVLNELSNPKPGASIFGLFGELVVVGLIPIVFAAVGALIVSRQPRNLIGWLLLGPAFSQAVSPLLPNFQSWTTAPSPVTLSIYLALWLNGWGWLVLIFPVFLVMLLFPTGRPPSPRWNWVGYLALGMVAVFLFFSTFVDVFTIDGAAWEVSNPIGFVSSSVINGSFFLGLWAIGLLTLAVSCVSSLVVRYRRASPLERQQIKWLLYACGLFGACYAASVTFYLFGGVILLGIGIISLLTFLAMATIPVAIAIAILRYRLWDIDVIIRRTLVYGALTLTLALVYFGSVILLQSLVTAVGGQQTAVVTVISTMVIAALFTPLRRRIQRDIDRRFYRKKYDAEKIVAAFGASLREEVDLEDLQAQIVAVVQETLQPETVSLWLWHEKKREVSR
jgi:hypothetical protein